jgi:septal ring factor EnvC (AmiA/AmiB activator)
MSMLKPDYYISHNGLPNVIKSSTRHAAMLIRQPTSRIHVNTQQKCRFKSNPHEINNTEGSKNQNVKEMQQLSFNVNKNHSQLKTMNANVKMEKMTKDFLNSEIRDSNKLSNTRNPHKTNEILSLATRHKIKADNTCNRNSERY